MGRQCLCLMCVAGVEVRRLFCADYNRIAVQSGHFEVLKGKYVEVERY
jgi:hypothetical protein